MSERLTSIKLATSIRPRSPEIENERNVAIADMLDDNCFEPTCMTTGPYDLLLGVEENRLILDIQGRGEDAFKRVILSTQPLRRIIRDYFMICESYYEALKIARPDKLEAIDMARRGVHNEGSEVLQTVLKDRIVVDFPTARRLLTLICVLHIK
jgi:uncharacterized protein (UPF0262 family)